jgi:two-component system cell cycle response regulator
MSPVLAGEADAHALTRLIGRELGGAIQMAALIEESQRLAATDALTSLANRRAFIRGMETEIARCNRHGGEVAMLLLDVDHFKSINDERGHTVGDRVLASIGGQLRQQLRASDHVARWGGEEFVVGLTGTDPGGARVAAERLRRAIADMEVHVEGGGPVRVTASIGLAAWRPRETLDSVIARADAAMYASKAAGRNRVTVDHCASMPANVAPAPFDPEATGAEAG